jgi:tryptophan 2,3-dioxygenase
MNFPRYAEYLRLPMLLDQQRVMSAEHDEPLFITVHQSHELWFKQMLVELTSARDLLLSGDAIMPRRRLERCHAIERLLMEHLDVLDTMSAPEFLTFRDTLGTNASGMQSAQFHEIALVSGAKDDYHRERDWHTEAERARLRQRFEEPSLWDGFLVVLRKHGFQVDTAEERAEVFLTLARDRQEHDALWNLAEALVTHDQAWAQWRTRHVFTAQRQIGAKRGTGDTTGATYLSSIAQERFFPELWAFRVGL